MRKQYLTNGQETRDKFEKNKNSYLTYTYTCTCDINVGLPTHFVLFIDLVHYRYYRHIICIPTLPLIVIQCFNTRPTN